MISVIMSCYREPIIYLIESISSILNQTYSDIELIVIVDDPTNIEIINYVSSVGERDERMRYYINERNMGLTVSLNRAKRLAKGEFVARMDADDISEEERLECQLKYLQDSNYDLVGCNVIDINEKGCVINSLGTNYPTQDKSIKKYLRINSAIPHPTWLVRKRIYDKYDYVDFPACEDYEFLTRIALDGYRMGNLKECKLKYRINSNGISTTKKVLQKASFNYVRNNYRHNRKSYYDKFLSYLESDEGRKKKMSLSSYYNCSKKLKTYQNDNDKMRFLLFGIRIFITEPEGRRIISNVVKERMLRLTFGHNY